MSCSGSLFSYSSMKQFPRVSERITKILVACTRSVLLTAFLIEFLTQLTSVLNMLKTLNMTGFVDFLF
jgi:hypothetical protein